MTDNLALYGTDQATAPPRKVSIGRISLDLDEDGIRDIRFDGVELIRAVTFLVRDRDWGTLAPVIEDMEEFRDGDTQTITWSATFSSHGATLEAHMRIEIAPTEIRFSATATPHGAFETNRAGFTVLHSVAVSGLPVHVEHCDGTTCDSTFPDIIEPWQPFMNLRALSHEQHGTAVQCRMEGDIFEMEDQRNWSDASFKTYVRPLALPWPYTIDAPFEQSVTLRFSGKAVAANHDNAPVLRVGEKTRSKVPQLALVLTAREARHAAENPALLEKISPQRITCHLDPAAGPLDLAAFAALQSVYPAHFDLEYAASCKRDLDTEFSALAVAVENAGLKPSSILVCPSVDRQSTPPGSEWPACPPLEDIHAAAARAFPSIERGGGMMSYFTELNRKRPPVAMLDFISHGTNPIVHAADDKSVMQTLAAIPFITRSAKAIAGGKPYRLGLSSIPMRQNPYGSRTMENPENIRLCMANSDPRHAAQFGAAFTLGYLAAIASADIVSWTPSALYGARGVVREDGTLTPLGNLLAQLSGLAGEDVWAVENSAPDKIAAFATSDAVWLANLSPQSVTGEIEGRMHALAPYATLRIAR